MHQSLISGTIFTQGNNDIMEINKAGILEFLNEAFKKAVNCECQDIEKVKNLFCRFIDDNPQNFDKFFASLEDVSIMLKKDLSFFVDSDPAVDNEEEIILSYPGFKAIAYYRIAHELRNLGIRIPSRIISEEAHSTTGIDIHPGAQIACPFFIDHGTGIVIGETAIVGHHVKLYQGVTLGALSLSKGSKMRGIKRHPTIGNYVTIYSNASILGDISIGNNVTIGGNVFLTESIADNTRVLLDKPQLVISKK